MRSFATSTTYAGLVVACCLTALTESTQGQVVDAAAAPGTDALGDPLPVAARLRLGTVRFRPPSSVRDLALSPDGKTLVTIGDQLIIWDTETGKERFRSTDLPIRVNAACYGIRSLCFTADGQHFYTPGVLDDVFLWDLSGWSKQIRTDAPAELDAVPVHRGMIGECRAIDVVGNGELIAYGSARGVLVFDANGKSLYAIPNEAKQDLLEVAGLAGNAGGRGRDRLAFGGHFSFVRFSPDGKLLAVVLSSQPKEIRLLAAATGAELRRIELTAWMVRLDFSPDSSRLVTTERDSAARLYDVTNGKRLWEHVVPLKNPFENYTSALAFSPDGSRVAVCATDELIHLLDAASGAETGVLKGHSWYPWALAFTSDSKMLYSSGWDASIRRWDVQARKQLPLPSGVRGTEVVAISPSGELLAFEETGGTLHLVDALSEKDLRQLQDEGTRFAQLRFSPDSRLLAAGGSGDDEVRIVLFDAVTGDQQRRWAWPKGADPHSTVGPMDFTPAGDRFAALVFRQGAAYLWDAKTGEQIAKLPHNEVYGLSFSPAGDTLATAGWDKFVRFWDAESGQLRREFEVTERIGGQNIDLRMYGVCYSPAGGLLATAHMDGTAKLWKMPDMELQATLKLQGGFAWGAMSFSPDGLWVATGTRSGRLELWDTLSGVKVMDIGRHQQDIYTLAFGRDSRTLLSGGDDGVGYVWDLRRGKERPLHDPVMLWESLTGNSAAMAFQALCDLSEQPDLAVPLLSEKLRPVQFVMDDQAVKPTPGEEAAQVQRLKKLLVEKPESNTIRMRTAQRALALLVQLRRQDAHALLRELVERDPESDLGRLAAAALRTARPGN